MSNTSIGKTVEQLENSFSFRDDQVRRLAIVMSHFLKIREELIAEGITANTDEIAAQLTRAALSLPSE
ncbi:hypothetical protein [Noviherbaspirillum massiliense]|uniref:hypothetical protein n=1 Tax=Noviherbaspirillum massiliense TaxID=1465823 RepID=UPI000317B49A|nr:hypothetical protein [Noviherbaspirillum massiliense]